MTTRQLPNCKGPENCETCRNQVKGHKRWRNLARQWREVQGQVKTLSELWLAGRCQVSTDLCAVKLYQPLSQMRTDWLGFGHVRYCNSTLMALLNFTTLRCVWDWKPASKSLRVSARWLSSAWTRLWHFIYIYIYMNPLTSSRSGVLAEHVKKKAVCAYWKLLILIIIPGASRAESGGTWLSVGTADSTMTAEAETGHQSAGGESVTSGLSRMKGSHHLR